MQQEKRGETLLKPIINYNCVFLNQQESQQYNFFKLGLTEKQRLVKFDNNLSSYHKYGILK